MHTEMELEAKLALKGRLLRKRVAKDDGRYLIYYSFERLDERGDLTPCGDTCSLGGSNGPDTQSSSDSSIGLRAHSDLGDRGDLCERSDPGGPGDSGDACDRGDRGSGDERGVRSV